LLLHRPLLYDDFKRAGLGGIGGVGDIDACFRNGGAKRNSHAETTELERSVPWRDAFTSSDLPKTATFKDLESSGTKGTAKGGTGVSELYQLYDMIGEDFGFHTGLTDIISPFNKHEEKKRELAQEKRSVFEVMHDGL
jgi:hypothetical protein